MYRLGDAVVFLLAASWLYRAAWRAWDRRQLRKAQARWTVIEDRSWRRGTCGECGLPWSQPSPGCPRVIWDRHPRR